MNQNQDRILITDAHSIKTLAIVRGLRGCAEIYTASHTRKAPAGWSRYVRKHFLHPKGEPAGFADWALETCKKNGISVIITPEDQSSVLVSSCREAFQNSGITVTAPPLEILTLALDKAETIRRAQAIGVPVPPSRILESAAEAIPAARELKYPVVVKPRRSFHWTGTHFVDTDGVRYADSDEQLKMALDSLPEGVPAPILQKYIPGRGVGINMLLDRKGKLCADFAYRRLRDVRPTGSGSVLRESVPMDERLRELSVHLLQKMNWWGVAMVEYRVDEAAGCPYLMEINGRFWGSLQLAVDSGVNFPKLLVDVALGRPVELRPYKTGVVLRWWVGDLLRTIYILRGKPPGYTGEFPGRMAGLKELMGKQPPGTRNQVLRWNDPVPALAEIVARAWR